MTFLPHRQKTEPLVSLPRQVKTCAIQTRRTIYKFLSTTYPSPIIYDLRGQVPSLRSRTSTVNFGAPKNFPTRTDSRLNLREDGSLRYFYLRCSVPFSPNLSTFSLKCLEWDSTVDGESRSTKDVTIYVFDRVTLVLRGRFL